MILPGHDLPQAPRVLRNAPLHQKSAPETNSKTISGDNKLVFVLLSRIARDSAPSSQCLHSVASIRRVSSAGCCFSTGPATPWKRQSQLLHEYYGLPLDAYEVSVEEAYPCDVEQLHCERSRHEGSGGMAKISLNHPLFLGGWADTAGQIILRTGGAQEGGHRA